MKKRYYIGEHLVPNSNIGASDGISVFYIESAIVLAIKECDGPFDSINELKKGSAIFKKLSQNNFKRSQQVLLDKNVNKVVDLIVVKKNEFFAFDFLKLLNHSTVGTIKSKKLNGIHYFDSKRMEFISLKTIDKNLVRSGVVRVFDYRKQEWFEKESTFFPLEWDVTRLFYECKFAFDHYEKDIGKQFVYNSVTKSGIPVEIIIVNNIVKSMYPIVVE